MVTITNGTRTAVVTKGVFEESYKALGWEICDKSKETSQAEEVVDNNEKPAENVPEQANRETSEAPEEPAEAVENKVEGAETPEAEEVVEEEEVETPISEMSLQELKAFAAKHKIDISAANKRRDVIDIIKAEMEA